MNKTELTSRVVEKTNLEKKDIQNALSGILEVLTESLSKGEKIQIPNIGTFDVKKRSERKGRNPQTGEEITIPETKYPAFSPSDVLKRVVNNVSVLEVLNQNKEISKEEENVLNYVIEKTKRNELTQIELKNISVDLDLSFEEVKRIIGDLMKKKVLDTMVYYGDVDVVHLQMKYHVYL
ncbi:HU family DNA-binding protein [Halobacillus salinus]|uniref:HU family DNA-binding protein n=1 Tax=Halobacillus salinus TaxID=192814 RepID=UPI0009A6077B